ncbi:LysR substrate-binding domain-containing protein [Peribacillus asahii]|uniref:Uncharacterized protein n=1 Tax=Peribacillus asahii TaxID=228899 RepID=A0A3Q9RNX5_9BACI|nr:LysR substrate-binding domain-containing protein [Peribacillus asahii]AZV44022.1 hypothetical protein BAOM_3413 [Peribacillus asahii]USK83756.1 hypothetical protein LIT35_15040 [Peribacillus asahii]
MSQIHTKKARIALTTANPIHVPSQFYRHNRGTTLTSKGKMLLTYSEQIFQLIEETTKVMKDDQTPKGPLIIGSMETTAAVRLPSLLTKYHHAYPDVDLILKTGPTEQNIQGVLQYDLDGAFVAGPIDHPELIQKTVIEEELVLITISLPLSFLLLYSWILSLNLSFMGYSNDSANEVTN